MCCSVDAPTWNAFVCSDGVGIYLWVGVLLWREAKQLLGELMHYRGGEPGLRASREFFV